MRVTVIGAGAVGAKVVRSLLFVPEVEEITVVSRPESRAAERLERSLAAGAAAGGSGAAGTAGGGSGPGGTAGPAPVRFRRQANDEPFVTAADVTVVSSPAAVRRLATSAVESGSHVVCPVDDPIDVRHLLELDERARRAGRSVVVGTAMAPGLSCVLAAHLVSRLDRVDEVHVASLGTGGPACARRHHAALAGIAVDWHEGAWRRRAGGSGRELIWFPEPAGGADCYRGALADPLLLAPAFTDCRRITARLAATRRDRMTSWLPMLRPPHPEGLVGAVRVEARGWVDGRPESLIVGSAIAPAAAAAAVTAEAVLWAGTGRLARAGSGGLAEMVGSPGAFLRDLAGAGIAMSAFEGAGA